MTSVREFWVRTELDLQVENQQHDDADEHEGHDPESIRGALEPSRKFDKQRSHAQRGGRDHQIDQTLNTNRA